VVNWHGNDWLATAVEPDETAANDEPSSTTVDVQVFRWVDNAWAVLAWVGRTRSLST
jgi:hypothetical protein